MTSSTAAPHSHMSVRTASNQDNKASMQAAAYTKLQHLASAALPRFMFLSRRLVYFHLTFITLLLGEIGIVTFFFHDLWDSARLAFALALVFASLFTYLILRLYAYSQQEAALIALKERYVHACRSAVQPWLENADQHIIIAQACARLAGLLKGKEYTFYQVPRWCGSLVVSAAETVGCYLHWRDVLLIREALLQQAVDEHIALVHSAPTDLEVHAALASAYVSLSSLHLDPRRSNDSDDDRWIPPSKYTPEVQEKFKSTAQRAIEEFNILNAYAPNDAWVHTQLAYSYRDMQMPEKEMREYEILLRFQPHDADTLYKLGVLYFQQGRNAQGLRVYEALRRLHYTKGEQLLTYYGSSRDFG